MSGVLWFVVGGTAATAVSSWIIYVLDVERKRLHVENDLNVERVKALEEAARASLDALAAKRAALRLAIQPSLDFARRFQEAGYKKLAADPSDIPPWHEGLRAATAGILNPNGWRRFEAVLDACYREAAAKDALFLDMSYLKLAIYNVPPLVDEADESWFA